MTRDHAKKILTHLRNGKSDLMLMDALDMAISALSTIEKIRAEVEELKVVCGCQYEDEREAFDWAVDEALDIIDKYIGDKDE